MKRYLIMGTVTRGERKGHKFLIGRGGCVFCGYGRRFVQDADYFATERTAKAVASRYGRVNAEYQARGAKHVEPCKYAAVAIEL